MSDVIARAVAAVEAPWPQNGQPNIQIIKDKRALLHNAVSAVLDGAAAEHRGLQASEERAIAKANTLRSGFDERLLELEELEASNAASARSRAIVGGSPAGLSAAYTNSETYHRGPNSPSFFRDLVYAGRGDADAADRLRRNNAEVGATRALGNTGAVGGSGGEFAPPLWITDDYIRWSRPGRVTADLFHHERLLPGASTVNLPKVGSGTTTGVQATQNTNVSSTDLTSASLSSGVTTIAGSQLVSQQLLDQSSVPFDRVVLEDLAADYAKQIGAQALTGTGAAGQLRGYLTPTSTNVVTWTTATPTAAAFYAQLAKLQGQINSSRFAAPDAVVMSPRRWAWLASYADSTGRPLVVPAASGSSFNSMATPGAAVAAGHVGSILGMDCYTDPQIPLTLGAGTNQDIVLCFPREDIWLWESDLRAEAFTAPYATSMGVLFRVFNYSAMIPDRYLASLGQIQGTGLVTPAFAS